MYSAFMLMSELAQSCQDSRIFQRFLRQACVNKDCIWSYMHTYIIHAHIQRLIHIYTHTYIQTHIGSYLYFRKKKGKGTTVHQYCSRASPQIQFMLLVKTYFTNPLGFKGILVTSSRSRQTFIKSLQKALILVKLLNVTPQTMLPSQ